jgi:hypothetical protein
MITIANMAGITILMNGFENPFPEPRPKKPSFPLPGNPPPAPVSSSGSPSGVIFFILPQLFLKKLSFIDLTSGENLLNMNINIPFNTGI